MMTMQSSFTRAHWKSSRQPCPICGHKGWCAYSPSEIGQNVWVCMYSHDLSKGDIITGSDGIEYVVAGIGSSDRGGNPILEPKETYVYRRPTSKLAKGESFSSISFKPVEIKEREVVEPFDNDKLDGMFRFLISNLHLSSKHREYLYSEGMTDEMIRQNLVVSFPEKDTLRFEHPELTDALLPYRVALGKQLADRFGDLSRFPNAYQNKKGNWTLGGQGGILFPLFDVHKRIIGLRVRPDLRWTDDKWNIVTKEQYEAHDDECAKNRVLNTWYESGKYLNFASSNYGPSMGTRIGVYTPVSKFVPSFIYITEGEKKAMISAELLKAVVLSVPGVNSWYRLFEKDDKGTSVLDYFYEKGCSTFCVAYDADKETNENVLSQQDMLVNKLRSSGFRVCMCDWNIANGKGLDDLLVNGYMPQRHFL